MSDKIYPKGLRTFPPREGAPDFVKGSLIVTMNELVRFGQDNPQLLTEYNGQKQLKLQMLDGRDGLYLLVDTYKPDANRVPDEQPPVNGNSDEPLPF